MIRNFSLIALVTILHLLVIFGCKTSLQTTLLATGKPCGIAVGDNYIYWTEGCSSEEDSPDGKIWKVAKNGGQATLLASDLEHPAKITVDNNNVYWIQWGQGANGKVWKMSVNGGQKTVIGQNTGFSHARPVVQSDYVYWSNGQNVKRVHINSATPQEDITQLPIAPEYDVRDFIPDNLFVYYTRWIGGMVEKEGISATIGSTLLAINSQNPNTGVVEEHPAAIATDGTYVYWGEHMGNSGVIKRVGISGGNVLIIAQNLKNIYDLDVDGSYVYWTDDSGVHKILKNGSGSIVNIDPSGAFSDISVVNGIVYWGDPQKGIFMSHP